MENTAIVTTTTLDADTLAGLASMVPAERTTYLKGMGFKGASLKEAEHKCRLENRHVISAAIAEASKEGFSGQIGKFAKNGAFSVRFTPPPTTAKSLKDKLATKEADFTALKAEFEALKASLLAK
jgi:hypothetical protein